VGGDLQVLGAVTLCSSGINHGGLTWQDVSIRQAMFIVMALECTLGRIKYHLRKLELGAL